MPKCAGMGDNVNHKANQVTEPPPHAALFLAYLLNAMPHQVMNLTS